MHQIIRIVGIIRIVNMIQGRVLLEEIRYLISFAFDRMNHVKVMATKMELAIHQ